MTTEQMKELTELMGYKFSLHQLDNPGTIYINFTTWKGWGRVSVWMTENGKWRDFTSWLYNNDKFCYLTFHWEQLTPEKRSLLVLEFLKEGGNDS